MTEPRSASVLPLAVTCPPDGRYAEALLAVVGRVGALAGEGARSEPFVDTVRAVLGWAFAHLDGIEGDIALRFARDGDQLRGDLQWAAIGGAVAAPPAPPPAPSSAGVDLICDVTTTAVHCRVSCRCA